MEQDTAAENLEKVVADAPAEPLQDVTSTTEENVPAEPSQDAAPAAEENAAEPQTASAPEQKPADKQPDPVVEKHKKQEKKSGIKDHARDILFILVMIICAALISVCVMMLDEYNNELRNQAATAAKAISAELSVPMQQTVNDYNARAYHVAHNVVNYRTEVEQGAFLSSLDTSSDEAYNGVYLVRTCLDGVVYTLGGEAAANEDPLITAAAGKKYGYMIGNVYDSENNKQAIAFYAPVTGSPYMDGIVLYYSSELLRTTEDVTSVLGEQTEDAELLALCDTTGTMREIAHNNDDIFASNYNLMEQLPQLADNEELGNTIAMAMAMHQSGVWNLKFNYVDYVLFLVPVDAASNLSYFGLFKSEDLYTSGYEFVNTILGALVLLGIILLGFALYSIISRNITEKRIYKMKAYNEELECFTRFGFEKELEDVVNRNRSSKFAVVTVSIFHFKFIREQIGVIPATAALKYVKTLIKKLKANEEIFGYDDEGRFLMLVHYRNREGLVERLNQLYSLGVRYKGLRDFNLRLQFGICEIQSNNNVEGHVLVDDALQAAVAADLNNVSRYRFFDEELGRAAADNAEIETRMEQALENGEFYLYFQPKFNIEKNYQEGCETLSRWLVPDENGVLKPFSRPDVFISVFENNGFIVRFDRQVYENVCKYINETVAAGRPLFPISVNVSRVTAMQADFVDTYAKIKQKYGIADNFIMLEFTESFANENYEAMLDIVNRLHAAGFKCSVDDFGSGYSSYNCIKSLPMDEIKLDKFFLEKGLSTDRDDAIISSVISVAKQVGMKVTQEGIETKEELFRLKRLGCQVIQGYYYSKPLSVADYIAFTTDESHNRMQELMMK